MTDRRSRDRVFALHIKHEGRDVPPTGWGLETTPGIAGQGADLPLIRTASGALLPTFFVMTLTVPPPSDAVIRLVYETSAHGITITTIWTEGMDAVQAVDALRRIAPIEVWNQLAVEDVGRRLALMQLNASGDGVRALTSLGMTEDNARRLLDAYSTEPNMWPTFQPEQSIDLHGQQWQTAMDTWRGSLESGNLSATARATSARPNARRNRVTRKHLEAVATVYREAQRLGMPPTKAVEDAFHTSYSTATRWVGLARSEGLLGPAQRGRSGEFSQHGSGE